MSDMMKHIGRTAIKTAIPVFGNMIADTVMPLGYIKETERSITGYNPNAAYNITSQNQTYDTRMTSTSKMVKDTKGVGVENLVAGGIQTAALIALTAGAAAPATAGASGYATSAFGKFMAKNGTSMAIQKANTTISDIGKGNKEQITIEEASNWTNMALNTLGNNKQTQGKIGSNIVNTNLGKTDTTFLDTPNINETLGGGLNNALKDIKEYNDNNLNFKF